MIGPKGYFLIIDRLNETLDQRIKRWRKLKKKGGGFLEKLNPGIAAKQFIDRRLSSFHEDDNEKDGSGRSKKDRLLITEEQFDVALQISSALKYLHEKSVMFRDLKPQNIGFDGELVVAFVCI